MEIFTLKDYQSKNILIIGNKPIKQLTKEQIDFINSFDIIIRVNGMNNLNETGGRVDWWWLNVWNWGVLKKNIGNKDYSTTKVVFVDKPSENFCFGDNLYLNLPKLCDNTLKFNTKWSSTDLRNKFNLDINIVSERTIPTTDVICISYMVNKFPNSKLYRLVSGRNMFQLMPLYFFDLMFFVWQNKFHQTICMYLHRSLVPFALQ